MRKSVCLVALVLAVAAACVPPQPPLGRDPSIHEDAVRVVEYNGSEVCWANLGVDLILNDDHSMTVISDVIVRGPGLPNLPCVYSAWAFSASLSCDDITTNGCGD